MLHPVNCNFCEKGFHGKQVLTKVSFTMMPVEKSVQTEPRSSESSQQRAEGVPAKCTLALIKRKRMAVKWQLTITHVLKLHRESWTAPGRSPQAKPLLWKCCLTRETSWRFISAVGHYLLWVKTKNQASGGFVISTFLILLTGFAVDLGIDVTRQKNFVIESFQFSKFTREEPQGK